MGLRYDVYSILCQMYIYKSHSQMCNEKKREALQVQMELIEQQKLEIKELKSAETTGMSHNSLLQLLCKLCHVCMWVPRNHQRTKRLVVNHF